MRNSRERERERRGGIQEKRREDERGKLIREGACVYVEMPVSVEAKLQGAIKKVIEDVAGRPDRLGVRG